MRALALAVCCAAAEAFSLAGAPAPAGLGQQRLAHTPLRALRLAPQRRPSCVPCSMSGLGGLFSQPAATETDDPFNPVRPDPATMNPKVVGLMEDMGVMKAGQWLSEEELLVEWENLYPGWQAAAWPLGAVDVGHIDARDRLMMPELGGDAFAWPMSEPPRVICVGEVLIDAIANDATVKPGDPADKWTAFAGGAPANVACALTKLGTPAGFIGAIGDDADGAKLLEILKECNLPTQMVQTSSRPTRRVQVTRDLAGDRQFAGFEGDVPSESFADCDLDVGKISGTWLYAADYLVTGTLSLASEQSRQVMMQLKAMADSIDMVRFVDVNWRPVFWKQSESEARSIILDYLQGAKLIKMTDEEAEWLMKIPKKEAFATPNKILKMFPDCVGLLITAGEKGCAYAFEKNGGSMPAFEIPTVDTTGAGDAFTAGFLHELIRLTTAWQEELVDLVGYDDPMPRGHLIPAARISRALEDKNLAADAVIYGSAVGAMTCMEEGAIAAQPSMRLANKFAEVYGESIVVTEEKREFEMPEMDKPWLKWQFSR